MKNKTNGNPHMREDEAAEEKQLKGFVRLIALCSAPDGLIAWKCSNLRS